MFRNRYLGGYRLAIIFIFLAACGSVNSPTPLSIMETPTKLVTIISGNTLPECQSILAAPTSGPDETSLFPAVNQSDHVRGEASAEVTIVEYGDFQCPGCVALAPELTKLEETFTSELRVVFRQLPLYDIHDKAFAAAQAAEVASDEGKFWEMHDLLYENYDSWYSMTPEDFNHWLVEQAETLGLDRVNFQERFNNPEIIDRVENNLEKGLGIGLRSTPFLLINGQIYNGPTDYNSLAQITRLIILGKRQFTSCPEMSVDPLKQYIATLQTEKGDIVIQLFADKAPFTVNTFVFLARSGWYDNITFHEVGQGLVQTGDPSGTGMGGPGFIYDNEPNDSLKFNQPGVVAMMNLGMDTNGSQFFITTGSQEELNGRFTIFGQVISGMEVLSKLTPRNPETNINSLPGDLLIKVTVIEN